MSAMRDRRALRRRTAGVAVRHGKRYPRHGVRRRSRFWLIPVVLLVAAVVWVGVRGYLAKVELENAQGLVAELKIAAAGMQLESLGPTFDELSQHSQSARALTSDPVWRSLEFVPFLGRNLSVVRELAGSTDDVVTAIGPLVRFASTLDPAALAPVDGAIPLEPFEDMVPVVQNAAHDLVALEQQAEAIDTTFAIGPIVEAKTTFTGLLDRTVPELVNASTLVPLLPTMLGSEGAQEYVVMFQNNAETRSLGGTALSFALITIDQGKIALKQTVPAGFDNFPQLEKSIVPVPDGFGEVFPEFGKFIPNATVRPSFPTAGAIAFENWDRARDIQPDGVISLDAVALGYVLRATGPIELSTGDVLDGDNVVRVLLNEILQKYNSGDPRADNAAQDVVYSEAVSQTFSRLASGQFDMPTLLLSVFQGFGERRLSYWSSDPAEQVLIEDAGLANDLPRSDDESDTIGIYLNDNFGSKLNYYLRTSVTASSGQCGTDGLEVHHVDYRLSSILDPADVAGLSPSILGEYRRAKLSRGVQRLIVLVYAPPGSTILSLAVDGVPITLDPLHDTDYPVARTSVVVKPGGQTVLSVDVKMSTPGVRTLGLQMTPLIASPDFTDEPLDCASVSASSAG